MKIQKLTNKGFTLVETLVAISILSISILGTFTAVQGSLQSSTFAKDQIIATYLIQDAVEYIRNVRDENALVSLKNQSTGGNAIPWLTGLSSTATDPCYFGKFCTVDSLARSVMTCPGVAGSCTFLKQDTVTGSFGYSNGSWPDSKFKREIQFSQSLTPNPDEVMITVTVSWTSGVFSKTLTEQQLLFNLR
jgi:prepilin-type N-terminal cleavage/methylation domain-containing protein